MKRFPVSSGSFVGDDAILVVFVCMFVVVFIAVVVLIVVVVFTVLLV
jgi:hypothetical protein